MFLQNSLNCLILLFCVMNYDYHIPDIQLWIYSWLFTVNCHDCEIIQRRGGGAWNLATFPEIYLGIFGNKKNSNIFLISAHTSSFSTQTPKFEKTIFITSDWWNMLTWNFTYLIVHVRLYKSNLLLHFCGQILCQFSISATPLRIENVTTFAFTSLLLSIVHHGWKKIEITCLKLLKMILNYAPCLEKFLKFPFFFIFFH